MIPRLVTIPFSHYCEKARWALDRARITYVEESHLPVFAWVAALRAGRRRTVPSLVTDAGAVADSTDILHWVDARSASPPLFPEGPHRAEVAELEDRFDRTLGPHARRIAYWYVLPKARELVGAARGVPAAQQRIGRLMAPALTMMIRRGLKVDEAGVARSRDRVEEVFEEVGRRIADGRPYLVGDRFTAADLTFAALASSILGPPQLADFVPLDQIDGELQREIERYRATPAGAFAMRLYAEERGRPGGAAAAA